MAPNLCTEKYLTLVGPEGKATSDIWAIRARVMYMYVYTLFAWDILGFIANRYLDIFANSYISHDRI